MLDLFAIKDEYTYMIYISCALRPGVGVKEKYSRLAARVAHYGAVQQPASERKRSYKVK